MNHKTNRFIELGKELAFDPLRKEKSIKSIVFITSHRGLSGVAVRLPWNLFNHQSLEAVPSFLVSLNN